MAGNAVESGRSVTSKVTAILLSFTGAPRYSLTEIARLTGLPTTTTHRLLGELTASRVLDRTADGDYRLGLPMTMLRSQPGAERGLEQRAPHVLADLAEATGRPVRLGVLRDLRVAYIEKAGQHPVTSFDVAATLPAHATAVGKALLAFSPGSTVEAVITLGLTAFTDRTLTRPDQLRRALAAVRHTRLALCDSELRRGVRAVATPVAGPGGRVVAALEVRVGDLRVELEPVQRMITLAARGLSRELVRDVLDDAPPAHADAAARAS